MDLHMKKTAEKYLPCKDSLGLLPRYYEIFEYRYGLIDGIKHTKRETGQKFGISGNRVGQIEARVIFEIQRHI